MPPSKPPIPRAFFLVAVANFLFFLNLAFFFLLPLWVFEKGGGEEIAGRLMGIQGFAGLAVLPAVGWLLDRFGCRRFMIFGGLVSAACSAGFIFVEQIDGWLYALRAIQGVAFTCAFTGAQTLAVLFSPVSRRAEAIGWFGISTILTHAISPAIGEEIIVRWGFEAMFAVGTGLAFMAFAIACFIPRPPDLDIDPRATKIDPGVARRAVATAVVAMTAYGFGFGATQTFVPAMMERFDVGRVGGFFIAWSVAAVSVRLLLGSASDRYGRRAVILPAMAVMSAAVTGLAFVRSYAGIVAMGGVFGLAQGLLYPTMNALVADWSNPRNIGRTQSLFSGSYSLGIASCAFFFGTIVENHGYQAMFLTALAITLVGMVIFATGPRDLPSHRDPETPIA
ncbi:MAG: MFS family permease [Hyphomicrobiaceae bacterium]|jgi:MFS family permease